MAAARLDTTLVAAYLRLAEGFAAEPGHADREPRRAAEVRDERTQSLSGSGLARSL